MKIYIILALSFFSFNAYSACNRTGTPVRFCQPSGTRVDFDVTKGTDCIYRPNNNNGDIKMKLLSSPKNGKAGVSNERFIYMPNPNFVGEDKIDVQLSITCGDNPRKSMVLNVYYNVK